MSCGGNCGVERGAHVLVPFLMREVVSDQMAMTTPTLRKECDDGFLAN